MPAALLLPYAEWVEQKLFNTSYQSSEAPTIVNLQKKNLEQEKNILLIIITILIISIIIIIFIIIIIIIIVYRHPMVLIVLEVLCYKENTSKSSVSPSSLS